MQPHVESRGFTGALSSAGLAIGSTPSEVAIAAPNGAGVDFAIDGLAYHYADDASVASVPGDIGTIEDGNTAIILIQVNAAGTVSAVLGDAVDNDDLANGKVALHWPRPSADNCPIGAVKVKCDGADFICGTTSFAAAGITDTYYNFAGGMPHEPLTS